jgi:hypothetical protein
MLFTFIVIKCEGHFNCNDNLITFTKLRLRGLWAMMS